MEIIKIREACQLARKVLDEVKEIVEPGITTDELDRLHKYIEHQKKFGYLEYVSNWREILMVHLDGVNCIGNWK